jgi:hypothetical protein
MGAAHPHPDFARGVPAKNRSVLNERNVCASSSRSDRGAEAGEPAADYAEVNSMSFCLSHGG